MNGCDSIATAVWVVRFLSLLPVVAIFARFFFPIFIDRVLVTKWFPRIVICYVLVSVAAVIVIANTLPWQKISYDIGNHPDSAWNHLLAPGSSVKGQQIKELFRCVDILGIWIFNVLLITTLINSLTRLREKWKAGRVYYNHSLYGVCRRNKIVVVLGNHESVFQIVKQCLDRKGNNRPKYVMVLMEGDVEEYRLKMSSIVRPKDMKRIVFCRGNLTSSQDLINVHIEKAWEVFILGNRIIPGDGFSLHDAECIKCVKILRDKGIDERGLITDTTRPANCPPLMCRVFFEYQTSYSAFQTSDIGGPSTRPVKDSESMRERVLVFKPMNFYELCSESVLARPEEKMAGYTPLDGNEGIGPDSENFVHLIIVGQTQMGLAIGIEAAHLCHYPNFFKEKDGKRVGPRTRISFVDENADIEKDYFMGRFKTLFDLAPWRYRNLSEEYTPCNVWNEPMKDPKSPYFDGHIGEDIADVEWEFIKGNISSPSVREYMKASSCENNAKCTIAICHHDQNLSVASAQYLPDEVCHKVQEILVFQSRECSVIDELVNFDKSGRYMNFRAFGSIGTFYDDSFCNEMESLFDGKLIYVQKQSIFSGKSQIACWWSDRYRYLTSWSKMRSFGTDYKNVDKPLFGKVEHSRWNMEQLLLGFRPATKDEQDYFLGKRGQARTDAKEELKRKKVHLNICSTEVLSVIDPEVIKYDLPGDDIL